MDVKSQLNRRSFLMRSSLFAAGGLAASYPLLANGENLGLKNYIENIVLLHFPDAKADLGSLADFSQKLSSRGWSGLEQDIYLKQKFALREFAELDRLIIMEYVIDMSPS